MFLRKYQRLLNQQSMSSSQMKFKKIDESQIRCCFEDLSIYLILSSKNLYNIFVIEAVA